MIGPGPFRRQPGAPSSTKRGLEDEQCRRQIRAGLGPPSGRVPPVKLETFPTGRGSPSSHQPSDRPECRFAGSRRSRSPARKPPTGTCRGGHRRAGAGRNRLKSASLLEGTAGAEAGPLLKGSGQQHETPADHRSLKKQGNQAQVQRKGDQAWPRSALPIPGPPGVPCSQLMGRLRAAAPQGSGRPGPSRAMLATKGVEPKGTKPRRGSVASQG